MKSMAKSEVIGGFPVYFGVTVAFLTAFVLIPLSSVFFRVFGISWQEILKILGEETVRWAFFITVMVSLTAAALNALFGTILAWVLERYDFPGKGIMDALIDLPFALPTAVAGITLSKLYSDTGLLGGLGFRFSYTHIGMIIALMFVGLPFTVRSIQPVLYRLPSDITEAAAMLGAGNTVTFFRVILPKLSGAIISGFGMSFARGIGEYGSIIYISGNNVKKHTQTLSYLIMQKLNVMDYAGASVLAFSMLFISFSLMILIHIISTSSAKKNSDVLMTEKRLKPAQQKKDWGSRLLIITAWLYVFVMLILPLFTVVSQAFAGGVGFFISSVTTDYVISAFKVTLLCLLICVPVVTVFGIASGFLLTRFDFFGKRLILALTDIPLAVSPVIAGLSYLMMFGRQGWAYGLTEKLGIKIVFALPGVILATIFVIMPYVTREVVPQLLGNGKTEEEAAALMGAGPLTVLTKIGIPKMRGALGYGIVLAAARCIGEFGAVASVSKTRGKTFTLPLEVDALYMAGDADSVVSAFALSLMMMLLACVFLILRQRAKGR